MKLQWLFRFFLALSAFGLMATGLWSLEKNGFFNVEQVTVSISNSKKGQEQLEQYLVKVIEPEFQSLKGSSLFRLNLKKQVRSLGENQFLKVFKIERVWPQALSVKLEVETIAFLSLENDQFVTALFTDGRIVKHLPMAVAPDAPFIEKSLLSKKEWLMQALKLKEDLPVDGPLSQNQLSYLEFDAKKGFLVSLLNQSAQINFGFDQFPIKIQRVSKVLNYLEQKRYDAQVIDGNLSKKVLVRLRKDP